MSGAKYNEFSFKWTEEIQILLRRGQMNPSVIDKQLILDKKI